MVRYFLTYMVWKAPTSALTSFSIYQGNKKPKGTGFPNLLEKYPNNTRNNMKSQIKKRKNRRISLWNY